jgi:hypothetical protein
MASFRLATILGRAALRGSGTNAGAAILCRAKAGGYDTVATSTAEKLVLTGAGAVPRWGHMFCRGIHTTMSKEVRSQGCSRTPTWLGVSHHRWHVRSGNDLWTTRVIMREVCMRENCGGVARVCPSTHRTRHPRGRSPAVGWALVAQPLVCRRRTAAQRQDTQAQMMRWSQFTKVPFRCVDWGNFRGVGVASPLFPLPLCKCECACVDVCLLWNTLCVRGEFVFGYAQRVVRILKTVSLSTSGMAGESANLPVALRPIPVPPPTIALCWISTRPCTTAVVLFGVRIAHV